MTTFVIVRHGNTFAPGETVRRIGSRTDLPLVASGHAQAEALGRRFAEMETGFVRALVSPSRRCRETAAAILACQPATLPIELCDWLGEIDHGPDEDRAEAEVIARIGAEAVSRWNTDGTAPPGWHVNGDIRLAAWCALFAIDAVAPVLIVTSNGAARFALLCDEALRDEAARLPSLSLRTGAWGRISVTGGCAKIDEWDVRP